MGSRFESRASLRSLLCLVAILVTCLQAAAPAAERFTASTKAVARLCERFSHWDENRDGTVEVDRLAPFGMPRAATAALRGTVLVLVEDRLLSSNPELPDLREELDGYAVQLAADGWNTLCVAARVYAGPRHQDGRTLLALRRFFTAVKHRVPSFTGAVLVGSFPEAYLVRQYNWRQHNPFTINAGTSREKVFSEPVYLIRSRAEPVATRCELVLADLDGRWDRAYVEKPTALPSAIAVYGAEEHPMGGPTADYELGSDTFEDFFFVNDGRYVLTMRQDGQIDFRALPTENRECSARDLRLPNPMARPDICVSRINPRGVALRPKPDVRGSAGEGLLSADGLPQRVTFASKEERPKWTAVWEPDPRLERRLIIELLQRDRRYRSGEFAAACKPGSISTEFGSSLEELKAALPAWREFSEEGYDIDGHGATVLAAIEWLKRPGLLRAFKAHSNPWGSDFFATEDVAQIEQAVGGRAWSWQEDDAVLAPGLKHSTGRLDFAIYRSIYENRVLPDAASLFIHTGCESIAPPGAPNRPYSAPEYCSWQGAEALMFYCNGLALVGRAKVFYDEPREFAAQLGKGRTWGDAWRHYFEVEARAASEDEVGGGIGRKRAYFWSPLGDWTVCLPGTGA